MHWIVKPAVTAIRTNPTPQQKNSSLFSEAPVVAGKILRRGQSVVLDEAGMKLHEAHLKRLVDAGSITIKALGLDGDAVKLDKGEEAPEAPPPPAPETASTVASEPAPAPAPEETKVVEELAAAGAEGVATEISTESKVAVEESVTVKPGKKNKRG